MRARNPSLIAETALALREILRWLLPAAALVVLLFAVVVSRGTLSLGGYGVALAAALVRRRVRRPPQAVPAARATVGRLRALAAVLSVSGRQ